MSKYEQERQEAYNDILEDGVMGQVQTAGHTYSPATSATTVVSPDARNVPMLRNELSVNVRYLPGSLIADTDIRLLIAALDDQGQPFDLAMEQQVIFNGVTYLPKGFEAIAPDGAAVMFDAIVSTQ